MHHTTLRPHKTFLASVCKDNKTLHSIPFQSSHFRSTCAKLTAQPTDHLYITMISI